MKQFMQQKSVSSIIISIFPTLSPSFCLCRSASCTTIFINFSKILSKSNGKNGIIFFRRSNARRRHYFVSLCVCHMIDVANEVSTKLFPYSLYSRHSFCLSHIFLLLVTRFFLSFSRAKFYDLITSGEMCLHLSA